MENFSHEEIVQVNSKRGGKKILYKGYSYNLKKQTLNKMVWRCRYGTCTAYLQTNLELSIITHSEHNHDCFFERNKYEYNRQLIFKRSEETTEKARDIIFKTMSQNCDNELYSSSLVSTITDKIKKNRNKKHISTIPEQSDIPTSIRNLPTGEVLVCVRFGSVLEFRVCFENF